MSSGMLRRDISCRFIIIIIYYYDIVAFENPSHFLDRVGVLYSLFMLCTHTITIWQTVQYHCFSHQYLHVSKIC